MTMLIIAPLIGVLIYFLYREEYKKSRKIIEDLIIKPIEVESGQIWTQKKTSVESHNRSRIFYTDYKVLEVFEGIVRYTIIDHEGMSLEDSEEYFYKSTLEKFVVDKVLKKDI